MTTVSVDNYKISPNKKATVTVSSDEYFDAIEVRGYASNDIVRGRGIGADLLCDDATTVNGVWQLEGFESSVTFDVEVSELGAEGEYSVVVFVRDINGQWNDAASLFDKNSNRLVDSDGKILNAARASTASAFSYTSRYSGDEINSFIGEMI